MTIEKLGFLIGYQVIFSALGAEWVSGVIQGDSILVGNRQSAI